MTAVGGTLLSETEGGSAEGGSADAGSHAESADDAALLCRCVLAAPYVHLLPQSPAVGGGATKKTAHLKEYSVLQCKCNGTCWAPNCK